MSRPRSLPPTNPNPQRPPLTSRAWWSVTAAVAVLIAIGAVIPVAEGVGRVPHLDKVVHLCEYLMLAWCVTHASRASARAAHLMMSWGLPIGYGALLEVVQAFIPYRSADWQDVLTNIAGTALGVVLARRRLRE